MAIVMLFAALAVGQDPAFTAVRIDPPFDQLLQANRLLMETSGAKVLKMPDGTFVQVAVASTALKDDSAQDRARAETVCQIKAVRNLVRSTEGVQIASVQKTADKFVVTVEDGKKKVTSVAEYFETVEERVTGWAKAMPVVGRWRSADGKVFYLAIGATCDQKGTPVAPPRKDQ